jgi:hypothetical protein
MQTKCLLKANFDCPHESIFAFSLLELLSKHPYIEVSCIDLAPKRITPQLALSQPTQHLLAKHCLEQNSSLNTMLQTFDVHIVLSQWKHMWGNTSPNVSTICIGIDDDVDAAIAVANCNHKLFLSMCHLPIAPSIQKNAIKKPSSKEFLFHIPESGTLITKEYVAKLLEKCPHLLLSLPDTIFKLEDLSSIIGDIASKEENIIDVLAWRLSLEEIYTLMSSEDCQTSKHKTWDNTRPTLIQELEKMILITKGFEIKQDPSNHVINCIYFHNQYDTSMPSMGYYQARNELLQIKNHSLLSQKTAYLSNLELNPYYVATQLLSDKSYLERLVGTVTDTLCVFVYDPAILGHEIWLDIHRQILSALPVHSKKLLLLNSNSIIASDDQVKLLEVFEGSYILTNDHSLKLKGVELHKRQETIWNWGQYIIPCTFIQNSLLEYDAEELFDVVILDILSEKQSLETPLAKKHVLPAIFQGTEPIVLCTNLAFASLNTSLKQHSFIVGYGLTPPPQIDVTVSKRVPYYKTPEEYIAKAKRVILPSTLQKPFDRYQYVARFYEKELLVETPDMNHTSIVPTISTTSPTPPTSPYLDLHSAIKRVLFLIHNKEELNRRINTTDTLDPIPSDLLSETNKLLTKIKDSATPPSDIQAESFPNAQPHHPDITSPMPKAFLDPDVVRLTDLKHDSRFADTKLTTSSPASELQFSSDYQNIIEQINSEKCKF